MTIQVKNDIVKAGIGDGYLIVKLGKNEPFLGCTNYRRDGTGCDGFMTKAYYLKHIKFR